MDVGFAIVLALIIGFGFGFILGKKSAKKPLSGSGGSELLNPVEDPDEIIVDEVDVEYEEVPNKK